MSHTSFQIRAAAEEDFEKLCALFEELDTTHREQRPDLFQKPQGTARLFADVSKLIAGPGSAIIVADDLERNILGLVTVQVRQQSEDRLRRSREYVEIDNLVVCSLVRRRGIGKALIRASMSWAAEHECSGVELGVHTFNADAIAFYERLGFSTTLRRMKLIGYPSR